MILATDTHYTDAIARTAGIMFHEWTDAQPVSRHVVESSEVADYTPGSFYKRELPLIIKLLGTIGLGIVLVRNVVERRGELATLRAFGFRRASLGWMVLAENGFLLTVGVLVGALSALAGVAPRLATIHVPWGTLAGTLLIVFLVGMLSSVVAVAGALRVPLLPELKAER